MVKLADGLVLTLPSGDNLTQALTSLHQTLCTIPGPLLPPLASPTPWNSPQITSCFPQGSLGAFLLSLAQQPHCTEDMMPSRNRVHLNAQIHRVDLCVSAVVMDASPSHDQEGASRAGPEGIFQLSARNVTVKGACRDYDDMFEASLTLTAQVGKLVD